MLGNGTAGPHEPLPVLGFRAGFEIDLDAWVFGLEMRGDQLHRFRYRGRGSGNERIVAEDTGNRFDDLRVVRVNVESRNEVTEVFEVGHQVIVRRDGVSGREGVMRVNIKCFFLEPTGMVRRSLRRYVASFQRDTCPTSPIGYHDATVFIDVVDRASDAQQQEWSRADERWPVKCQWCQHTFTVDDQWQLFREALYRPSHGGEEITLRDAPAGAMWWAPWYDGLSGGPFLGQQLAHTLVVKTPGGEWMPDMRASNCTMPFDDDHHCWVLHGLVPNVTVDKNGKTCGAGGGSISQSGYHGFLRNGELVEA